MLRSSVYVLGGVVAGVALTENKEAVGDVLFSVGTFVKSFASELRNVEVSGSKLGELPGLKQTLEDVSSMELKRDNLQFGVNQASSALTDVVRRNNSSASKSSAAAPPASSSSSSLSGYLTLGLLVTVPASIYLYVDASAREQAQKFTQQALQQAQAGLQQLQAAAQDEAARKKILSRISHDVEEARAVAVKYYSQGRDAAQKQLEALLKLLQQQLNKAGVNKDQFKLFDA